MRSSAWDTSTTQLAYAAAVHRRSIPQKIETSYPVFSVPAFNFLLQMQGITVANELPKQAMGKRRQFIKKPAAALAAAGLKSSGDASGQ